MKIRGDIESVNLSTSERYQRVAGDGENRLEPIHAAAMKAYVDEMEKVVIPQIVRTMRHRAELASQFRGFLL